MDHYRSLLCYLFLILGAFHYAKTSSPPTPFTLTGGSIYFSAHPADSLLFQNPDLFHDLYVYKPVTAVIFTSGDRGIQGNFSEFLERGLEHAYWWMTSMSRGESEWGEAKLKVDIGHAVLRWLKKLPTVQIIYLRLPDGAPDGEGYKTNGRESLRKLYLREIQSISAIDGSATYTLESLKELIAKILHLRKANDIRVLDFKTPLPSSDRDKSCDHADHAVTARLVVDVVKQRKIAGKLQGYASAFMRKLKPNIDSQTTAFSLKADAFFKYAEHDVQMCKNLIECEAHFKDNPAKLALNDDVHYVTQWLEREYYVS